MAHDVFISFSSRDKTIADAVCHGLEEEGIRCWISPRDIRPGQNWGGAIVGAIASSRVMVLVFSGEANRSNQVLREVERAVNKNVIVIPFRVEDVVPSDDFEYYLSAPHWLDAFSPPLEGHIKQLANAVRSFIPDSARSDPPPGAAEGAEGTRNSGGSDKQDDLEADRIKSERDRMEREQAEQRTIAAQMLLMEQERLDKLRRDQAEQERAQRAAEAEKRAEQQRAEQQRAEQQRAEQQRAEQQRAEQQRAEQQRAEQQRAQQQQAEQQRAEQQRSEEQRAKREAEAEAARVAAGDRNTDVRDRGVDPVPPAKRPKSKAVKIAVGVWILLMVALAIKAMVGTAPTPDPYTATTVDSAANIISSSDSSAGDTASSPGVTAAGDSTRKRAQGGSASITPTPQITPPPRRTEPPPKRVEPPPPTRASAKELDDVNEDISIGRVHVQRGEYKQGYQSYDSAYRRLRVLSAIYPDDERINLRFVVIKELITDLDAACRAEQSVARQRGATEVACR